MPTAPTFPAVMKEVHQGFLTAADSDWFVTFRLTFLTFLKILPTLRSGKACADA